MTVALGRLVVRFHDEGLVPYDITLAILAERGDHPDLLGILMEGAERNLSTPLMQDIIAKWRKLFATTPEEALHVENR